VIRTSTRSINQGAARQPVILVVEDEYFIRLDIADELRSAGFEVVECGNADEAADVLNARTDIAALFTDIRMPGLMDGVALVQMSMELWPGIAVAVTSAQLPPASLNGTPFLPKPYDPQRVVRLMAELTTGTPSPPQR